MKKFYGLLCVLALILCSSMVTRALILHETAAWITALVALVCVFAFAGRAEPRKPSFWQEIQGKLQVSMRQGAIINALRFYADRNSYRKRATLSLGSAGEFSTAIEDDAGNIARSALASLREWPIF